MSLLPSLLPLNLLSSKPKMLEKLLKPGVNYRARVLSSSSGKVRLSLGSESFSIKTDKLYKPGSFLGLKLVRGEKGFSLELGPEKDIPEKDTKDIGETRPSLLKESFSASTRLSADILEKIKPGPFASFRNSFSSLDKFEKNLLDFLKKPESVRSRGFLSLSLSSDSAEIKRSLPLILKNFLGEGSELKTEFKKDNFLYEKILKEEPEEELIKGLSEFKEFSLKSFVEEGKFFFPLAFDFEGLFYMGRFFLDLEEYLEKENQKKGPLRAGLSLYLESLGNLKIDILLFERKVYLLLASDREKSLDLFRENIKELEIVLKEADFQDFNIYFKLLDKE